MIAKNSNNNKWLTENPLFKNKDQRYYYDFGTGKKVEREEVKEEREAFLNSANKTSTKPQNQKKDDFLEGFDDPYGEKREQERKQKEQERKERLAKIRANADKRTWSSQTDPFLEGFNQDSNEQRVKFPNTQLHATPSNTNLMFPNTQLQAKPLMFPNTQIQAKPQDYDAFREGFNDPNGDKKTPSEFLKEFASETIQDVGAHIGLHATAHTQYPWTRYAEPLFPAAIGGRITSSSAKVSKHKDTINEVASRYNVPKELIGGIIFKEQLTKSAPDLLANIDKSIREDEKHSTGLGAIRAETARDAWGWVDSQKELPKTNAELQWKLTYDKKFNIETIAAVLLYEAKNKEIISDISEASNLTTDQWWEAVKKYNGSGEYARKVYEYLPFTTELLD